MIRFIIVDIWGSRVVKRTIRRVITKCRERGVTIGSVGVIRGVGSSMFDLCLRQVRTASDGDNV